jgi:hypothetical protein
MEVRTCVNCACHWTQENTVNPLEKQSFCRRDPANATQMRAETPRMRDGKAVLGRDQKPIMENTTVWVYLYKPTLPTLVCFDGWRPMNALPGDKTQADFVLPFETGKQSE